MSILDHEYIVKFKLFCYICVGFLTMRISATMKIGRFIFLVLVGLFVYWAAAYDTFANFLYTLADKLQPWAEVAGAKFDKFIDGADVEKYFVYFLKGWFFASCLALILSVVYLFALKDAAKKRNTHGDLTTYVYLSVVCVLLTCFKQDTANWWVIPVIPITSYVILYPLLYLPHYRYFRWVFAFFFDILVFVLGFIYVSMCTVNASFFATIMTFIVAGLSVWYAFTHRKKDSCKSCKKYVEVLHVDHHIDETEIRYQDIDTEVATGHETTTTYDKYGHKVGEHSRVTGWKRVKCTHKIITRYFTDTYRCPYCGYEYTTNDSEETKKTLGYKQREEPSGTYQGDLPNA